MSRPLWVRLFIGLWAVWFNAALLEAPGIHTCAVHSGVVSGSHAQHGSPDVAMSEHAGHGAAAPAPAPDKDACACTCLGVCCGVSPFVSNGATPSIAAHYAAIAPRRIGYSVASPTIDRPYDRPFANGPPTLV